MEVKKHFMNGMKAKSTNTFGIRYLSKGRPGKSLYAVKFEYGCANGKHGKYEYLYEGNDFNLAKRQALKTQELMQIGGATNVLEFKDYDVEDWLNVNKNEIQ